MKINNTKELKEKIESLISNNEINYLLADMFLYVIGSRDIIDEKELEIMCEKNKMETNDFVLSKLIEAWEIDIDDQDNEAFFQTYIAPNVNLISDEAFINNPYYQLVKPQEIKQKDYELKYDNYAPYELFALDDIDVDENYIEKSQIAYFTKSFPFLVLNHKKVTWMSITPNEILTMEPAIKEASGNVIVFGLGLGYFPFMVSNKENVKSVTIIEKDTTIINIFRENILPLFPHKEKIKIICEDAFTTITRPLEYDYAFVDLWHQTDDGIETFLRFKKVEAKYPDVKFLYWLEKSFYAFLRRAFITLLEEALEGVPDNDERYTKYKNSFDKIINIMHTKTKNLVIKDVDTLDNLLKDDSLLKLML